MAISTRTFNPEAVNELTKKEMKKLTKLGFTPATVELIPPVGQNSGASQGEAIISPEEITPIQGELIEVAPPQNPLQKIMDFIRSNPLIMAAAAIVLVIVVFMTARK